MKGSLATGTKLFNGHEFQHQFTFGLDCLNEPQSYQRESALQFLLERTPAGVGSYSALFEALLLNTKTQRHEGHKESRRTKVIRCRLSLWPSCLCVFVFNHHV